MPYNVIQTQSLKPLINKINELEKDGWEPQGEIAMVESEEYSEYTQVVVKNKLSEEELLKLLTPYPWEKQEKN